MSKDKVEASATSNIEEESHVKHNNVKRTACYVASFDGPIQIITQAELNEKKKKKRQQLRKGCASCFTIKEKIGFH